MVNDRLAWHDARALPETTASYRLPSPKAPGTAAPDSSITAAEQRLGVVFDDSYLRVIRAVNGWASLAVTLNFFAVEDLGTEDSSWSANNVGANAYFDSEEDEVVEVPPGHARVMLAADHETARYLVAMIATDGRESQSVCYDCQSGYDLEYPSFEAWLAATIANAHEFIADELKA
ncbi:SMI1/KNR4 family protein [Nocardia sp. CDC153]|uniref:SMI1/KNR4 family protein n=1 Tax=Nocardia sp. CDC153 TaxID=3112167 RepID=UPI002DB64077|nr:SMI1/KNR4 family protein [Nocardia sp. CDC153]MEC3951700.1 SMI1/KNR4 family protein [Nocardia sp. CDC153]